MWICLRYLMVKRRVELKDIGEKKNIYMIWEYLFKRKYIRENTILRKCLEYRLNEFLKNRSERFIFLTSAIDIAMYMDSSNFNGKKLFGKKEEKSL